MTTTDLEQIRVVMREEIKAIAKAVALELRRAEIMDGDADYLVSLPYAEQQKILKMRREQK